MNALALGIDFGTDSVRSVIIDTQTGSEISSAVSEYPRWKEGLYCNADQNQWRQHPLDYLESLQATIKKALAMAPPDTSEKIVGIGIDTTGSTPVAVDQSGKPLALLPEFTENPNAMFVLWKDHTAIQEANELNELASQWETDYTKYVGGIYSSEWFWAKALHILRVDAAVREAAYSWVEHCDWIPFELTGNSNVEAMKRSRCAAGHKALWHEDFGGLPPNAFFKALDPLLDGINERLFSQTFTSDQPAGHLSEYWAKQLGLSTNVVVAVGAFDAHMGAVGGEIEPYHLSKVMGTSTCDMLVAPGQEFGGKLVPGICGQVDGSVIPGMIGLEAGQSAFGDVYAWFKNVLSWPVDHLIPRSRLLEEDTRLLLIDEIKSNLLGELTRAAEKVDATESGVLALDWLNGRRTPDANQLLKGMIAGLQLGSTAPKIFRALVEATCYGARSIVDRFESEGVPINGVIGMGGVAKENQHLLCKQWQMCSTNLSKL